MSGFSLGALLPFVDMGGVKVISEGALSLSLAIPRDKFLRMVRKNHRELLKYGPIVSVNGCLRFSPPQAVALCMMTPTFAAGELRRVMILEMGRLQ